jgi:L-ascorbate metabolism protein UlaG (beta-lactamase superfamily)
MKIKRYKQSSFLFEIDGKNVYVDPYGILENQNPADLILISHSHSDHYSQSSVQNIIKEDTILLAPRSCTKILEKWNGKPINPGEQINVNGLKIQAVPMYTKGFIRKFFHNQKKNLCGYIISKGENRIYHAGDTDFIPEMKNLKEITIACLPVGGFFTMNGEDALEVVKILKPKIFIPMHELRTDLDEYKREGSSKVEEAEIIILKEGNEKEI